MEWEDDVFSTQNIRGYRLTILTQLRQTIDTIHSPEELFQWLVTVTAKRFHVPVFQLWTCICDKQERPSAQLRAMSGNEPFQLPRVINSKVKIVIEDIAQRPSILSSQPIEQIFPQYLAILLHRHGLSHCAYCLISRKVEFAGTKPSSSYRRIAKGLTFTALLFLQRNPGQEFISAIGFGLEQTIATAESHQLLLPIAANVERTSVTQDVISKAQPPTLVEVIPRLKQSAGLLLSSNPFTNTVTIANRQALRLYKAIDGSKSVAELCRSTNMTAKEAYEALQILSSAQYIEIYTSDGKPVDTSLLFKNR